MGNLLYGRVVDEQNKAVEFATVFLSDSKGKPITPSKNTTTDNKGNFSLDGLKNTDYVTVRYVGLTPKTVLVKNAVNIPNAIGSVSPTLLIKMIPDSAISNLGEVTVESDRIINKPKKNNTLRNVLIISGTLLLLATLTYVIKESKTVKN